MTKNLFGRTIAFLTVAAAVWAALLTFFPSAGQDRLFFCSAKERHFFDYFCPRSTVSAARPYVEPATSPYIGSVPRRDQCYPALANCLVAVFPESISGAVSCTLLGLLVYLSGVFLLLRRHQVPATLPLATLLVSGQVLYSFEVGNTVFYAAGALCVFLAWYDSDDRRLRVLAALALALAAVMKISPALFGLAYLFNPRRRDWRMAVLSAGLFAVLLLVPFAFWGGAAGFVAWVENAGSNSRVYVDHNILGVYGLLSELVRCTGGHERIWPHMRLPVRMLSSAFAGCLLLCAFRRDEDDFSRLCLLAMGTLFLPPTMMCYTVLYVAPLFVIGTFRSDGRLAAGFAFCWFASCLPLQIPLLRGSGSICLSAAAMIDLCLTLAIRRRQL